MFIKSFFAIIPLLLSQNLIALKIDSAKNKGLITAQETEFNKLNNKRNEMTANNNVSIHNTEQSIVAESKDSLEPEKKVTTVGKNDDSLQIKTTTVKTQTPLVREQMDSIWLKSGDTLIGKITLDKDRNTFLFSKDTIKNQEIKPTNVVRFATFSKEQAGERFDVFSIFNEFYFLESSPNVPIRIFSNRQFKAVLNDGPKYYIIQKKYCLFKNDVPYFTNSVRFNETLVFLVNDCKDVAKGFKTGHYNKDNFIEAITHYNRCNKQR